jgi:hypothetical protein
LPITRPDLHFLYNLAEEVVLLIAYVYQIHQISQRIVGADESRVIVA